MIFQIYVKHLVRLRCNIYLKYRLQQLKIYVPSYILIAILLRVIVKYNIFFLHQIFFVLKVCDTNIETMLARCFFASYL